MRARSSWIQAAFLVGWALGGGFFGRIGDRLGRSRALSLTILTYALFTGLSFFAQTWWQLLIFRFLAALGIGGEWAVGASLLSETWPQALAAVDRGRAADRREPRHPRRRASPSYAMARLPAAHVFLVGHCCRRCSCSGSAAHVPEPEEWHAARAEAVAGGPGVRDLFRGEVRRDDAARRSLVCAFSLTAWWAFMFWHPQHLRNLPELAGWERAERERLVTTAFFLVIGDLDRRQLLRRRPRAARRLPPRDRAACACASASRCSAPSPCRAGTWHSPVSGCRWWGSSRACSGCSRCTCRRCSRRCCARPGAGFCYNIGRIAAAFGTVFFGLFAQVGDFRVALFYAGLLFLPAALLALFAPDLALD